MPIQWKPGDILFVGDSLTDIATMYGFAPMLPRAFNASNLASRISDVVFILKGIEDYFSQQANPFLPSKLVVLVGTNDLLTDVNRTFNTFTAATQQEYFNLFLKLRDYRLRHNCELIIRSIPPGIFLNSITCAELTR